MKKDDIDVLSLYQLSQCGFRFVVLYEGIAFVEACDIFISLPAAEK